LERDTKANALLGRRGPVREVDGEIDIPALRKRAE
jgi:hypothetical protein